MTKAGEPAMPVRQWYIVRVTNEDQGVYYDLITKPFLDAHGNPMPASRRTEERGVHFDEWTVGLKLADVPLVTMKLNRRVRMADCLNCQRYRQMVLSERVVTAMDNAELACPSSHRIPFEVYDSITGALRGRYTMFWGVKRWSILDLNRAEYEFVSDSSVIADVLKWVIECDACPPEDLFRCADKPKWICSDGFHDLVRENGFTGFEFQELECS